MSNMFLAFTDVSELVSSGRNFLLRAVRIEGKQWQVKRASLSNHLILSSFSVRNTTDGAASLSYDYESQTKSTDVVWLSRHRLDSYEARIRLTKSISSLVRTKKLHRNRN